MGPALSALDVPLEGDRHKARVMHDADPGPAHQCGAQQVPASAVNVTSVTFYNSTYQSVSLYNFFGSSMRFRSFIA